MCAFRTFRPLDIARIPRTCRGSRLPETAFGPSNAGFGPQLNGARDRELRQTLFRRRVAKPDTTNRALRGVFETQSAQFATTINLVSMGFRFDRPILSYSDDDNWRQLPQ